jgi:hypothetical protein
MKTIHALPVNYLRIYPVAKERTSSVSGTKSLKVGALIFMENLPKSAGQTENNVIEFTAKQLDNLCAVCRVRGTGEDAWYTLSELIGTMESVASVTALSHNKGEKYIAEGGVEALYSMDSTSCQVDSVVLPEEVRTKMRESAIMKNLNWKKADQTSIVNKLLGISAPNANGAPNGVASPVLEGVK